MILHINYEDKMGMQKYVTEGLANRLLMLDKRVSSAELEGDDGAWDGPLPF
jgi:hypothetical protein